MIEKQLYDEMCNEFFPVFKQFASTEKYAITLGGSHGKGLADKSSDFDFRVYFEVPVGMEIMHGLFDQVSALVHKWKARGVEGAAFGQEALVRLTSNWINGFPVMGTLFTWNGMYGAITY